MCQKTVHGVSLGSDRPGQLSFAISSDVSESMSVAIILLEELSELHMYRYVTS